MSNRKPKKQPKSKLVKSQKSTFYNLVKDDADWVNKTVKWVIIIHYPLYIVALFMELFTVNYPKNGYIGPASMVFPMSLTGCIIMEISYFIIITYISLSLLIAMKSYRENNPKLPIR